MEVKEVAVFIDCVAKDSHEDGVAIDDANKVTVDNCTASKIVPAKKRVMPAYNARDVARALDLPLKTQKP